jgi:4-amino-4-deoxy-L-arabinose transferase-like glycosyltransferase
VSNILHADPQSLSGFERWLPRLLFGAAFVVLFFNLGSGALFEPDERRNAEKARQILLLNDWVTPHEDFYPVIDKPIFFYWLIALACEVFAMSEWSARLPSALAPLGCAGLIYRFVRRHWGPWEALWSTWIMLPSAAFLFSPGRFYGARHLGRGAHE